MILNRKLSLLGKQRPTLKKAQKLDNLGDIAEENNGSPLTSRSRQ